VTLCPGTSFTVFLERWRAGDGAGPLVEATEHGVIVEYVPDAFSHLRQADHLAIERLGQELLSVVSANGAGTAHAT